LSEPIVAIFTYSRNEYILAMKRHYKTTLRVRLDVMAGIAGIVGGSILALTTGSRFAWLMATAGALLLAMVAYAIFVLPIIIYKSQPKLKNEYRLFFSDDGIEFKTAGIDAKLEWSLYTSWLSDNDFYILYHGKRDLSVIPRRSLSSNNADQRLREMLTRKIGPAISSNRAT
jgi:YcxB-like protein